MTPDNMSEYAARAELGTAINRHTEVRTMMIASTLNVVYPPYEQPVSGDMLTVHKRDTKSRITRRRALARASS